MKMLSQINCKHKITGNTHTHTGIIYIYIQQQHNVLYVIVIKIHAIISSHTLYLNQYTKTTINIERNAHTHGFRAILLDLVIPALEQKIILLIINMLLQAHLAPSHVCTNKRS